MGPLQPSTIRFIRRSIGHAHNSLLEIISVSPFHKFIFANYFSFVSINSMNKKEQLKEMFGV